MADNMWQLLQFLKEKSTAKEEGQSELPTHSEDEKQGINDQLIATLEKAERVIDDALEKDGIAEGDVPVTVAAEPALSEHEELEPKDGDIAGEAPSPSLDEPEPSAIAQTAQAASTDAASDDHASVETDVPSDSAMSGDGLMKISVSRIRPNPFQPRKIMGENEITELSQSIKELGVLQPILVQQVGDAYELIAGERRLRAAQRAGLTEIPAMVVETDPLRQQIIALVENIQRKNLSAIEEAVCLEDIISRTGWSQTELARRTGRSQASIANKLRLLRLDQSVQDLVVSGKLGERQARSLLSLSVDEQRMLAQKAIDEDLSAKALEELAESWNGGKKSNRRSDKGSQEQSDGPAGDLLGDLAALINKHRSRGIPAKWKVKQMQDALLVEISIDLQHDASSASEAES